MWFLTQHPTSFKIVACVTSLPKSYQNTVFKLTIECENPDKPIRVCMPFPWAPNKDNGGITINKTDRLLCELTGDAAEVDCVTEGVRCYRKVAMLRQDQPDVLIPLATDLAERYAWDDWGFLTFEVEHGKTYWVSYTHKICVLSTLVFPAVLPINLYYKRQDPVKNGVIGMEIELYAVNADRRDRQTFMLQQPEDPVKLGKVVALGHASLLHYKVADTFDGGNDLSVCVCNWDSSDDDNAESSSSEEE